MSPAPSVSGETLPLRSAMKQEDDGERTPDMNGGASSKAVQITEPVPEPPGPEETLPRRQYSAGLARRLSGRPAPQTFGSSRASLRSQASLEALSGSTSNQSPHLQSQDGTHHHRHPRAERFIAQVAEWVEHERTKQHTRKSRIRHPSRRHSQKHVTEGEEAQVASLSRPYSPDSQSSDVSLDRLQRIIDDTMSHMGLSGIPHHIPRAAKKPSRRLSHLQRTASSDTEYQDGDVLVPSCDAVLDNTKTLSYLGGQASVADDSASTPSRKDDNERQAWIFFKNEIIRLAHTLRLKGWRRVPLDSGETIAVERLSGALTNAVYVVFPPEDMTGKTEGSRRHPAKLLLRIYGPQVEHIIDRENELSVLRRLSRKKIGPRLLGTFQNGRFEQYLNASPLTAEELRDPDTSVQIAKRMRELHDGIEVLDEERIGGPAVWNNWDNWLDRVSRAITFLDHKMLSGNSGPIRNSADTWKESGLICGTAWPDFKAMVDKYRRFLISRYHGDSKIIRNHLVFAHNDTQYGNILRVRPDDKKSPLLMPNYQHKQLVVIDFEYAAANVRGLEFANQFTEWCYNYHDEEASFACDISKYPSPQEQRRFITAYVTHRPEHPHRGAATPVLTPLATPDVAPGTPSLDPMSTASASSDFDFMLDARVPPGGWKAEEARQQEQADAEIRQLMEETRLWRPLNSAQWVAWGIMQATIPGFDPEATTMEDIIERGSDAARADDEAGDPEAFDYLRYAQERAMFFWGDCVSCGLVKLEDLPEDLRSKLKILDY
ncbi:kinase-like domain-containing protein [Xylariaceae sp. FL0804]|nr:kinase-like domain-containing protein [Xylariaceae sp. FL0804]